MTEKQTKLPEKHAEDDNDSSKKPHSEIIEDALAHFRHLSQSAETNSKDVEDSQETKK